ncbi:TPA: hypothetical protein IU094_002351 [Enterococcus faecalis]|uniref:hypothetical protein n=1 Tax=Enterococcus faecalis TaxID=1351 RepID=UPI00163C9214|nr:hypothetical protein [Enterococcus faecalis]EHF1089842.1 hypothetical protein [Enterococcus faecalis]MBD9860335.1 hypothetical protein [Enterococcus faecalis]HAP5618529.1 hypothetical protein [Enterococcus faecalis]HAP5682422.1 hypothetical protein [Enterococcus faecalis]
MTAMDNAQVKRKHFRFPAYDDEQGVKLPTDNERNLFQDDLIGKAMSGSRRTATPAEDTRQSTPSVQQPTTNQPTTNKQTQQLTAAQQEQLSRHRSNLPDYTKHASKATKKNNSLFGTPKGNGWTQTYKKKEVVAKPSRPAASPLVQKTTPSYFVPKYIPASVIPEEQEPSFTEEELLKAMKKDRRSYVILDDEPTAFQVKDTEEDPTVRKFNIPTSEPEIPLTRRQYQQIKPDLERFGEDALDLRSRSRLNAAKKNAKSQTAYGKKLAKANAQVEPEAPVTEEKKKGILDKPLSGMLEDSSSVLENSKYFS